MSLDVIYEDNEILIVDKPGGMPVHPSKRHQGDTLSDSVKKHLKLSDEEFTFRCLTRLDKDTSGLVLIAKTLRAAQELNKQMAEKKILREYEAIVEDDGSLPDSGIIEAPVARMTDDPHDIRRCVRDDGEYAATRYMLMKRLSGRAVVHCILETGRTHQIRVHMAHIGHPVVGDRLYNDNSSKESMKLRMMHLEFFHPDSGFPMNCCVDHYAYL